MSATEIIDQLVRGIEGRTGASVHGTTGAPPTDGFMVSLPDYEAILGTLPGGMATEIHVWRYVRKHYSAVVSRNADGEDIYFGAWVEPLGVFLDLSVRVDDRDEAIALGREYDQLAIYDVAADEVIGI